MCIAISRNAHDQRPVHESSLRSAKIGSQHESQEHVDDTLYTADQVSNSQAISSMRYQLR